MRRAREAYATNPTRINAGLRACRQAALFRAAQIAYDLGFDGPVFVYSWAASGTIEDYLYDNNSATLTVPRLKSFLKTLSEIREIQQVNIIAHSMGTLPLLAAMTQLDKEGHDATKFREIILAAPDIDRDVFDSLAEQLTLTPNRICTIYASGNDRALQASYLINGKIPRAGGIYNGVPQIFNNVLCKNGLVRFQSQWLCRKLRTIERHGSVDASGHSTSRCEDANPARDFQRSWVVLEIPELRIVMSTSPYSAADLDAFKESWFARAFALSGGREWMIIAEALEIAVRSLFVRVMADDEPSFVEGRIE